MSEFHMDRLYPLKGGVQHYLWGEDATNAPGGIPYIAQLLNVAPEEAPWAELWLGGHPKLPSEIPAADGSWRPLPEAIAQEPVKWIGQAAMDGTGEKQLPYLLKVLTCRHPLSIQSHPDKTTAARLHISSPNLYPDSNDKAEVIIALGKFEAMAGFRNFQCAMDDLRRMRSVDTLLQLLASADGHQTFRELCNALFNLSAIQVAALLSGMESELRRGVFELVDADRLFLRLLTEYPGDRGAFFAYLLNHVTLEPGEALFLEPNSPHAYLEGCGIECMSNSDNVIRAGLTVKAIDVPTLLNTLNFQGVGVQMVLPVTEGKGVKTYHLPTPKFQVTFVEDAPYSLKGRPGGATILLVLEGTVRIDTPQGQLTADRGSSWIAPAAFKNLEFAPASPHAAVVVVTSVF